MAKIRIRTTHAEQDAIKREIKRLINDNLVGTGNKYFMANKVVKKIEALRGTRGLPRVFGQHTIWYFYNQLIKEGEIIVKTDEEGEAYLVTKENPNRTLESIREAEIEREQTESNKEENKMKMTIPVVDANNKKEDEAFARLVENKIQKSFRNSNEFTKALSRAIKGAFDEDIECATGADLLKVYEKWTIRKIFSIELGEDYYKLYKEVFYIEDPHKYYFEEVNPTIYRRIAPQHEEGDREWADNVAKHYKIEIVEDF